MNPYDRLDMYIAEKRLIRGSWKGTDYLGRELACLLVAIAPAVDEGKYHACPATLMPEWLARLTVFIDDEGAADKWDETVRTYARLIRASQGLTPSQWSRLSSTSDLCS